MDGMVVNLILSFKRTYLLQLGIWFLVGYDCIFIKVSLIWHEAHGRYAAFVHK